MKLLPTARGEKNFDDVVVEGGRTDCSQAECFRGEIQAVADGACFEMHIAITTVTMGVDGTLEIADHPKNGG